MTNFGTAWSARGWAILGVAAALLGFAGAAAGQGSVPQTEETTAPPAHLPGQANSVGIYAAASPANGPVSGSIPLDVPAAQSPTTPSGVRYSSTLAAPSTAYPVDEGRNAEPGTQAEGKSVPVVIGQRTVHNLLLRILSLDLAKHSYFIVGDDVVQVTGNAGSRYNHQVRIDDRMSDRGREYVIYVSQAQAQALIRRSEYFAQHTGSGNSPSDYVHPCPTCANGQQGYNFLLHNSNSFVYNMLSQDPAGSIAPPPVHAFAPGYTVKPDDWYSKP